MLPYPRIESNRVMIYTARRVPAAHTERWATVYLFFLPLLALSRSVTPLPQPSISPAAAAGRLEGAIQGSGLSGSCKGHDLFFFFWLCDQAPRLSVFLPPSTSSEAGMWWFLKPKKKVMIWLCFAVYSYFFVWGNPNKTRVSNALWENLHFRTTGLVYLDDGISPMVSCVSTVLYFTVSVA